MAGYSTVCHMKIMEFFAANADKLVTVNEIDDYLKSVGMDVNISTIYRYLNKLTMENTVIKYVAEKGGMSTFQYVGERHVQCRQHLHIHCVICGKVIHLECEFMDEIKKHVMSHHGFELECDTSVLNGICSECRKDAK